MSCSGEHRYFVADVAVSQNEGKVTIIALCTACGDFITKSFQVAPDVTVKSQEKS